MRIMSMKASTSKRPARRLSGFDYLVIAGGAVNVLVVVYIVGYWLIH